MRASHCRSECCLCFKQRVGGKGVQCPLYKIHCLPIEKSCEKNKNSTSDSSPHLKNLLLIVSIMKIKIQGLGIVTNESQFYNVYQYIINLNLQ